MEMINGLLSNWFFVIGVTVGVAVIAVGIGYALAHAKIKKGFDVYED